MSRDYKGSGRQMTGSGKGNAFIGGLLLGLLLGLGIAVGIAWYLYQGPSPFLSKGEVEKSEIPIAKPEPAVPPPSKPRFEFYKILPGSEQPITERELKEAAKKPAPARDLYFLQAGSFQGSADADNLKARLALLGVEATISTVALPDKGTFHRVRIGPYTRIEDLNRARESLKQNGVETTLIKAKEATQ
jgi:cell division protein FtsN